MIRVCVIIAFVFVVGKVGSQNISIDFAKRKVIGFDVVGDTTFFLCESKRIDGSFYPMFYIKDSVAASYKTYYHLEDFDSITNVIFKNEWTFFNSNNVLKDQAVVEIKKMFHHTVGMLPKFGVWTGKVKPGRYKLFGYRLRVYDNKGKAFEGIVYYYFNKQSFFKRFFKRRKLIRRIKRLPIAKGKHGCRVIFKNDKIEEGGTVHELYYTFNLKYK